MGSKSVFGAALTGGDIVTAAVYADQYEKFQEKKEKEKLEKRKAEGAPAEARRRAAEAERVAAEKARIKSRDERRKRERKGGTLLTGPRGLDTSETGTRTVLGS